MIAQIRFKFGVGFWFSLSRRHVSNHLRLVPTLPVAPGNDPGACQ